MSPTDLASFNSTFFGDGNLHKSEDFNLGGALSSFAPFLQRLQELPPKATILPRKTSTGLREFYAIAFTHGDLYRLRETFGCFIGPTYSDFDGRTAPIRVGDPIDQAVHDLTKGHWLRVQVDVSRLREKVGTRNQQNWPTALLLSFVQESNKSTLKSPRGLAWTLRDFRLAIEAMDQYSAQLCLNEISHHGLLDAVNLRFLEVEYLDAFGETKKILEHEHFQRLVDLDCPPPVMASLWTAVYRQSLSPFEAESKATEALARFVGAVLPAYGQMLDRPLIANRPEVQLMGALRAVALKDLKELSRLRSLRDLPEELGGYLQSILALAIVSEVPTAQTWVTETRFENDPETVNIVPSILDRVWECLEEGRFDDAYLYASDLNKGLERAEILVVCASHIGEVGLDREVWTECQSLPLEDLEKVARLTEFQRLKLRFAGEAKPPDNWPQWFHGLGMAKSIAEYASLARTGVEVWNTSSMTDEIFLEALTECLASGPPQGREATFQAAIPMVVDWIRRAPEYRDLVPGRLKLSLAEALLGKDEVAPNHNALLIAQELLRDAVSLATNIEMHKGIYNFAVQLVARFTTLERLDWAIDLCDCLASEAQPRFGLESGRNLLECTVTHANRLIRSLTKSQFNLLEILCQEASCEGLLDEMRRSFAQPGHDTSPDPFDELALRSVTIYTLDETQAKHTEAILRTRSPKARVALLHDKVNTPRLSELARNSDYFLVITRCATHAATVAIENARAGKAVIRPAGRGAACILGSLERFIVSARALENSVEAHW